MKQLLLIGIGPGDPQQITLQAVDALRRGQVFFLLNKGAPTRELLDARLQLLQRHVPEGGYRVVEVTDAARDGQARDYVGAVQAWHLQRAALYQRLLEEQLQDGETGAFLLWGDPGLYDSTLRMLALVRERGMDITVEVIPGISSVQALAARHAIALNRIGEPLTVLPGRQLARHGHIDNVVVMLDGQCTFTQVDAEALFIYWGAYLGTPDELLIAGPLSEVRDRIVQVREAARIRKGWIMDTYLLRRMPC
ncbi:precorrin-6A synthase (deacetylating) [Pseudomonas sp. RP23018S]|uniref:precorrin-6A synthase (deacetylating) n=1 Tax=Pseudomonas sp. RP23018S TaxID=3096037 RepID=UPI002ACA2E3E|nr:precorrin-6A synthase (deacetylating) [Pseudomonas sp. RP23018S]MDZ5603724.1 precorrin-6A synthase (deacetylating) [Pseudomonas sp. RP23018S]